MKSFLIEGPQRLNGEITVSGAKNSVLKLLMASMLTDREVVLRNFPFTLEDVSITTSMMSDLGVELTLSRESECVSIKSTEIRHELPRYDYPVRTTYLLAPPLLHSFGKAKIPYPGGCRIGDRGYDIHMNIWRSMGASVVEKENYIEIQCPGHLNGADIEFPLLTIGGTENAILCAVLAEGTTRLYNSYISPEVFDLIAMLQSMGADITVKGNSYISINGVRRLYGTSFKIMSDRIEALTWIIACAITRGQLTLREAPLDYMEVPLVYLRNIGLELYKAENSLYMNLNNKDIHINPFEVACGSYPGVISDMQPLMVILATQSNGVSSVIDYRYPERFNYVAELQRMGGEYGMKPGIIRIKGPVRFSGARVRATDLRGGAALLISSLIAQGRSSISDYDMIRRGYNNLEQKLRDLNICFDIGQEELQ